MIWLTILYHSGKKFGSETQIWLTVSKVLWRKRITNLSHSVVMFVIWISQFGTTVPKKLRSDLEFCLLVLKPLWGELQICITVPKILRGDPEFCITNSKSFWGEFQFCIEVPQVFRLEINCWLTVLKSLRDELHFCITVTKVFRFELQFCLTMFKFLWGELQVCKTVGWVLWRERFTILSHSVEKFVRGNTNLHWSGRKFEIWKTIMPHKVE